MFNLLMFNGVDWTSDRVTVTAARMLEYTDDRIIDWFRRDGDVQFDRLSLLPCLFCEEGMGDEPAYVGRINRAWKTNRHVDLEISLDSEVPTLNNGIIYENRNKLDMPIESEFTRNHWAVKNADVYRFIVRDMSFQRQHPKVFHIPKHETIKPTLVSVMMPFDSEFDAVYSSIRSTTNDAGLECKRADDFWEEPAIIQDIISLIDRARIVICDCTGRNPNVFYEAGIAHTLGREVILITQNKHDIPFDLRHLRYVPYLNNAEGREKLTNELLARIATVLG